MPQTKERAPSEAATSPGANNCTISVQSNNTPFPAICKEKKAGSMTIAGREYPITGYIENGPLEKVPIVDIPMISDYKWQLECLKGRIANPELYRKYEDVDVTIATLWAWLKEHGATDEELKAITT